MVRVAQRGQVAVEWIGLAVLVAVMLAAATAWLVREARPPSRPPAFIEAVAKPLVRDPAPFEWRYPLPRPYDFPRGRDDEPIGRFLRAAGRGARDGIVLAWEVRQELNRAFNARLRQRGLELLRDPLATLGDLPQAQELTARNALRRALLNAQELWDYAQELRTMPAREAALRAGRDAGTLAADLVVETLEARTVKGASRLGRDRASREP
jgi:hypothetical protein